jgi:tetratricopeptide (TPR) repeat protein
VLYAQALFDQLKSGDNRSDQDFSDCFLPLYKFNEISPNDPCTWNLQGLVLERDGQYERAVDAFSQSVSLLQTSNLQEEQDMLVPVHSNMARCLLASGRYQEAIVSFGMTSQEDCYTHMGLGTAYFFDGQLESSLKHFELALNMVSGESTTSACDVTIMVGQVLYALGTPSHLQLAKAQFFEW